MARFVTELLVKPSPDQRSATLLADLVYESDLLRTDVRVPAGFWTDYASVPRAFWVLFPPTGRYGEPAIVHDFLYRHLPSVDRYTADAILFEGMKAKGCWSVTCWTFWSGVRAFGWRHWKKPISTRAAWHR